MNIELSLENSMNVYVEKTDDFLKKLIPSKLKDKKLLSEIKNLVKNSKRIGEKSGFGEIYLSSDSNVIIKKVNNCAKNEQNNEVVTQLCTIAKEGDVIYRIPNTYSDKMLLYAPNYIIENLIGKLVYENTKKYTSSFIKVLGFQYDSDSPTKTVYTVLEPLKESTEYLKTDEDYIYYVFKIIHALSVAQKIGRFTHYDLHDKNVMCRSASTNAIPLSSGEYIITEFDFEPVIIDYGFSRYETEEHVLNSRVHLLGRDLNSNVNDNYFFNPYYDIYCILKSMRNTADKTGKFKDLAYEFFEMFVNPPEEADDPKKFTENFMLYAHFNKWRPYPERLVIELPDFNSHKLCNADMMLHKLSEKIKSGNYKKIKIQNTLNDETNTFDMIPKSKILNITFNQYRTTEYSDKFSIKDIVLINSYTKPPYGVDTTPKEYHREVTSSSYNYENPEPWIHIALIDQIKGLDEGYKFRIDCCRVDIRNYFQTDTIKSGIAINAAFFKIKGDFSPLGYFKTDNYISDRSLPKEYENYFGIVCVDKDGMLRIDKSKYKYEYEKVLTCGPILVWRNEKIFKREEFERIEGETLLLQCRKPKESENKKTRIFQDKLRNCDAIEPGELPHAANPNPRSAIFITNDHKVGFVYVEGRDAKGPGMDLAQLTELCLHHGAKYAINLDGGRSSQMLWKNSNKNIIYQPNYYASHSYPVGSIISFVK